MGFLKKIKTLDSRFSWSFFSFLIAIISIGYAVYVDHFKEEKPKVVFDILSNTQVLSVKEDINKLDIIYDGQNLKEQKKNLILLTIRISNEGNEDISEEDFYSQIPFGLKINSGKIAESPFLIDASNKFLKSNLILSHDSLNNVSINKLPINKEQYFTIKILTICSDSTMPSITPMGNISGINEEFPVRLSYSESKKEEKSFIELLTLGGFGIHVARFFFYIFSMVAFGLLIGIPMSKISDFYDNKKRKSIIQKFRDKTKIEITDKADLIFEIFLNDGQHYINWLSHVFSDKEKLTNYLTYFENRKTENLLMNDYLTERPKDAEFDSERRYHFSTTNSIISKLLEKKFIITGGELKIDDQFKNDLLEFKYFLDIQ